MAPPRLRPATTPAVPTRRSIRTEMNGIAEAPGKTWFWELESAVIDAGRCIQCGVCVAACPSDSIGVGGSGLPQLVKMCTGCSLCWDFCPRAGLRYEATWPAPPDGVPPPPPTPTPPAAPDWKIVGGKGEGLGVVKGAYTARTRAGGANVDASAPASAAQAGNRVQDGGVVTTLLVAALAAGDIDGVLLARESPSEPWKGVAHLATSTEEVLACGGSFYNQTMALANLDLRRYDLPPEPRIAVVGTPCEVQGIRAMQSRDWYRGSARVDAIVLTIALLCTKSFDYEGLMLRELRDRRGIDLASVGKVDVIKARLVVEDRAGATLVSEPVKDFHGAALKGCDECADFVGRGADISVGSVGSADGWSSVLVRTEAGARAFALAAPRLEMVDLERPDALEKLDAYDRKVTLANMRRDFDPDGPLFVEHSAHFAAYQGTDRAPVPDPPIQAPVCPGTLLGRPATRPATQPADGPATDLAVPPEPVDERERVRAIVLERTGTWEGLACSGQWVADTLWPWWGVALGQAGLGREALAAVASDYRHELWLWLMGERTWEHTATGLAGRLRRRTRPVAGENHSPREASQAGLAGPQPVDVARELVVPEVVGSAGPC